MINVNSVLFFIFASSLFHHIVYNIVLTTSPWERHKLRYGLTYTEKEDEERKQIFQENLRYIREANAANLTYTLEMNHLGHMSLDELVNGFNNEALKTKYLSVASEYHIKIQAKSDDNEPAEVDWRKVGAVSPVKNQGACGSCWAFSTTGAMEGQYKIKYGTMKMFSEQQLVDCDKETINQGCEGGLPVVAFEYVREFGLLTEDEYSYKARDGRCRRKKNKDEIVNVTTINGYTVIGNNEKELTTAIYRKGPISVAIDASFRDFQFYHSGVYRNLNCGSDVSSLDHAVLVVGYGHDPTTKLDYYIVKNSWSETWGDNGYIKMVRNDHNNCGIASFATYPTF